MSSFEDNCKMCIECCKKCSVYCKKKEMLNTYDTCLQCISICKLVIELSNISYCTLGKSADKLCVSACKYCIKECGKYKDVQVCIDCVNACKKCIASANAIPESPLSEFNE